jgi:signal transduction histidine kinase
MSMRFIVLLLFYFAVVIRTIAFNFYDDPVPALEYLLLVAYGLLLVTEPLISRRLRSYGWVYLGVQFGLVVGMMLVMPSIDFIPTLFFPLSFQAVLFFGRQMGFLWIVAFILSMIYPIMLGWEWQVEGIAIVILDSALCFLVGSYAHLIQRAELARRSNQQLLIEVQEAYRKLQDHATQIEERSVLQERSRMSRELHDSVTQTIFSMNLTVQAARMLWGKDLTRVAEQLDRLQELARGAVAEIQVLVSQLSPRPLVTETINEALQDLIEEQQRRDGLHIDLEVCGQQELPQTMIVGLYRIVQEALNNVAKHAGTKKAFVRLHLESHPAYLEVEDYGYGFEPEKAARDLNHIGLAGMADRARELGWRLEIDSKPGRGTRIRVEEVDQWQTSPVLAAG